MNFYHDQGRNLFIYEQPNLFLAQQLLQAIPEAKQVNGSLVVVPHTLRNSQILRLFNWPVAPVMHDYDWPRHPAIKHPYDIQKIAANFAVLHPKCCNLSDMGTGKTLATLWAADWIMQQYPKGECRALIVGPLSILDRVWSDAIFKNFLNRRTCKILYGTAEQRCAQLNEPADFYIINFDGVGVGAHTRKKLELDGFSKQLSLRTDIRIVVIDEASAYKDSTTKRHRIARMVFGKKEYLWCLSGTPTPNAPTDAFGIAKLVNNAKGKSFTSFKLETMYQPFPGSFKWLPRQGGYDKARELLTPAIRFSIDQVWDGPPLTTQQRQVELTDEQKKLMKDLKRDFMVQVRSGAAVVAVNEAAARLKFIQISLGAIYDAMHKAHAIDAKPRYEELVSVLEEAPGKVLVFAPLTSVINNIYNTINKKWPTAVVNGEVSQKARSEIFRRFQSDDSLRIIVADPGTMAHGLDLYAARTVVWYGTTDKPELYAQANARAHRPGQKFPVSVVQIVSNNLEREIFRRLENNLALQGALLDLVQTGQL